MKIIKRNKEKNNEVYKRHGYKNREDYLKDLGDEFGVSEYEVYAIADMLGEAEDFDGLVSSLEDYSMMYA